MTSQLIKKKNQINIAEKKILGGTILMGWSEYIKKINF